MCSKSRSVSTFPKNWNIVSEKQQQQKNIKLYAFIVVVSLIQKSFFNLFVLFSYTLIYIFIANILHIHMHVTTIHFFIWILLVDCPNIIQG